MCVYKTKDGKCKKFSTDTVTSYCVESPCEHERLTNYDRIRNMSVEKLSDFLMDWAMEFMCGQVPLNVKSWLEQEVEE